MTTLTLKLQGGVLKFPKKLKDLWEGKRFIVQADDDKLLIKSDPRITKVNLTQKSTKKYNKILRDIESGEEPVHKLSSNQSLSQSIQKHI